MPERPAPIANRSRIVLAFDFGARRIGVATGNLETRTATPRATLQVDRELPWTAIDRIVDDWRPAQCIVGVPEGEGATAIARRARAFAAALDERYGLPVALVDETLTSVAAEAQLTEGRRSGMLRRRVRRGSVDRVAACLIAEQWMNEQPQ